jgi:phage terminase large subunit-like protein
MSVPLDRNMLSKLSERDLKVLIWRQKWLNAARPDQIPPENVEWNEMICLAGRGWGKTLTGMQWLGYEALRDPQALPSFVIAPTLSDVRYTCFEGPTGLVTLLPKEAIRDFNRSNLIITLDNGAVIRGFSAEEPERLRGPQCARAVLEEVAAWGSSDEATFDMFMMGLRLGPNPKFMVTTTPKPRELIRKLNKPKAGRIVINGTTYDNRANLPKSFFDQLAQYEGTQLGRQELDGELIDGEEGGVIRRDWLQLWPAGKPLPKFDWIVMSYDTALTALTIDKKTHNADPTACQVWGIFWHNDRTNVMLLDCWQDHLGFPDLLARVKKERLVLYGDDESAPIMKPLIGPKRMAGSGRKCDIILIEAKGSGISLLQSLEREGIDAHPYNPGNADKLSRLHMVSHIFAQKRVWVPESQKYPGKPVTWSDQPVPQLGLSGAVTQWCSYRGPGSLKHEDHVDAMTQAIRLCLDKQLLSEITKSKPEREREDNERAPRYTPRGNPYAQ